ncbi:Hypothetical predicted protein [Octopus vulgaris]|uniref:Uncharacterized protein n=1 Tax=Octopus vulgaris TaxID=6645 RepID=A0AA36EYC2_OCTVU|nr:Hypothetical predicted protein [Octopus vulgaris]
MISSEANIINENSLLNSQSSAPQNLVIAVVIGFHCTPLSEIYTSICGVRPYTKYEAKRRRIFVERRFEPTSSGVEQKIVERHKRNENYR